MGMYCNVPVLYCTQYSIVLCVPLLYWAHCTRIQYSNVLQCGRAVLYTGYSTVMYRNVLGCTHDTVQSVQGTCPVQFAFEPSVIPMYSTYCRYTKYIPAQA